MLIYQNGTVSGNVFIETHFSVSVFDEKADDYRIVMTDAEAEHLRRKGVEAMTLYAFLNKGVELYSDRSQIGYRKERAASQLCYGQAWKK